MTEPPTETNSKLKAGDWVVAVRSHVSWSMSNLIEGELYCVTHVGSDYHSETKHYPVQVSGGLSYQDDFFRKATLAEVSKKLFDVFARLQDLAKDNLEDARNVWFGADQPTTPQTGVNQ